MIKKALTPQQTLAITLFVLSCFAVLLYLWITFGGTTSTPPGPSRWLSSPTWKRIVPAMI